MCICGVTACDDDCGERDLIYREHKRQQLADIELSEIKGRCVDCNCAIDDGYVYCWSCENGGTEFNY